MLVALAQYLTSLFPDPFLLVQLIVFQAQRAVLALQCGQLVEHVLVEEIAHGELIFEISRVLLHLPDDLPQRFRVCFLIENFIILTYGREESIKKKNKTQNPMAFAYHILCVRFVRVRH